MQDKADSMASEAGPSKTFQVVDKAEQFSTASIVSLHYVLNKRSRGIVGARDLDSMEPFASLIDTSHSLFFDQAALADTLERE